MSKRNAPTAGPVGAMGGGFGPALAGRPALPAVNLLPPSVGEERKSRALQRQLIAGLVAAVVLLGAGYVVLAIWKNAAEQRVVAAQLEATRLANEKRQYDDLISVERQLAEAQEAKVAATGYEIQWPEMFWAMINTRPAGSVVNSISGTGMSAGQGIADSSNVLARPAVG
ncbi:MAG: hypothetical protein LBD90_00135, partial [Bifidobacteriaceae bacterium]|nr:hypothetical protein [Bifidobacteriaceae bacterium]